MPDTTPSGCTPLAPWNRCLGGDQERGLPGQVRRILRSTAVRAAAAVLLLLLPLTHLAACGGRSSRWEQLPALVGPQALDGALVYLQPATASLLLVTPTFAGIELFEQQGLLPAEGTPLDAQVTRLPVGSQPSRLFGVPGARSVLVLDGEERAVFEARDRSGSLVTYPLGASYNALAISADARWAVAYFDDDAPADGLFTSPDTVVVLDLAAGRASQPLLLASGGARPQGLFFLPPLALGARTVRLAFVAVEGALLPLDLDGQRLGAPIRLALAGAASGVQAEQLLARAAADQSQLEVFVRVNGSDVFELALVPQASGEFPWSGVVANIFPQPARVRDLVLVGAHLIAAVPGSQRLQVIDPVSGDSRGLAAPAALDRLLIAADGARVLAYGQEHFLRYFCTLDRAALDAGGAALRTVYTSEPVDRLEPFASGEVLVRYTTGRDFGVYDPLSGDLRDRHLGITPSYAGFDAASGRLLALYQQGQHSEPFLATLALRDERAAELALDRPGTRALALAGGAIVAVLHDNPTGELTFVPAWSFTRETSVTVRGFALDGVAEWEMQDQRSSRY